MKLGKENLKKLGILVIILVVLKLGINGIQKIWPHEYGCNATNFAAINWIAQDAENYYYVDENIYKLDKNGNTILLKENNSIKEQSTLKGLNVVGEWIYYIIDRGLPNNIDSIYKMKVDGSEDQELLTEKGVYSLFVIDSKVYFIIQNEGLFVMSNTGTNKRAIYEGGVDRSLQISQYLLKGETEKRSIKLEQNITAGYLRYSFSYYPQIEGDGIYVAEDLKETNDKYHLRRLSVNGKEDKRIAENITNYLVTDNYIYYGKEEAEKVYLFRMNLDGGSKTLVLDGQFTDLWHLNYVKDKLFFAASTNLERDNSRRYCVDIDGTNLQELPE